ncbi:MAG: hypothetical protein Tsb002_22180 [Wenzhouxiangellaceae bacterium]
MRLYLILACALLSACSSLLPEAKSVRLFILTGQTLDAEQQPQQPLAQRLLVRATGSNRFDSNRLLLVDNQRELLSYQGARWSAPLPGLIASTWAASLEQSQVAAIAYATPVAGTNADQHLLIHLRQFEAQVLGGGMARCQVALIVEYHGPDQVVRQRAFSAESEVSTADAAALAAGFDQAHGQVLSAALNWLGQLALTSR